MVIRSRRSAPNPPLVRRREPPLGATKLGTGCLRGWTKGITKLRSSRCQELSALVADGAVLGFVILHRDLEHIVATNAHTMDLWRSLIAGPRLGGAPGVLVCLRLAHDLILTRLRAARELEEKSRRVAFCKKVSDAFDDLGNANRPIKNRNDPAAAARGVRGSIWQRDGFGARGY